MDPYFSLTPYIEERLAHGIPNVLELYSENELIPYHQNHIYEEIVIPAPVKIFINELNAKRIISPPTLRVIDHMPYISHSLEFNIPESLEHIILRDVNIQKKQFHELFPKGILYRYENCLLNGAPLHEVAISLYKLCSNGEEPPLTKNSISHRLHKHIINKILDCQYAN